MKYSVIVIAMDGIELTTKCVQSIINHSKDYELIVIDNASSDGTKGYFQELNEKYENISVIESKKPLTFAQSNNLGLPIAKGEYIIFLNNDTEVYENWLDRMEAHFHNTHFKNVAAVGPVSSASNGRQCVGIQNSNAWHAQHRGKYMDTGILYGWCMMIRKECLDVVGGFDERFENSHEDNDLSLRLILQGYKLLIAYDTYIYHLGQGTLRKQMKGSVKTYMQKGYENRERYHDKWMSPEKKKLVAVYRTNGGEHLEESLTQTSKFADSILIHLCRSGWNAEQIKELYLKFPKIKSISVYEGIFQEDYERNFLLQKALKLYAYGKADWCISIDDDEIYENRFIDQVQKMMNPRNPEIMGYWCNWRTIWETRNGKEYWRTDSTFGRFTNYRFFKLVGGQEITSKHPEGHHCGSAPQISPENLRWSNIRVKHLGYDTPEQRQKKFEFYQANDHFKSKADIGNEDYSHLIDMNVKLAEYKEQNGISMCMMIKNEEDYILECLESMQSIVSEYVIVDTGSTDRTWELLENFKKHSYVPVKLFKMKWEKNYSIPRNFAKSQATQPWILHMDADERFKDILKVWRLIEEFIHKDCFVFHVVNYLKNTSQVLPNGKTPPKYASSEAVRLIKNKPEFFWNSLIHETFEDSITLNRVKVKGLRVDLILHHYGYLKEKSKVHKKLDEYENLNLEQAKITENSDPRPYFNLALHYLNAPDKQGKAIEAFKKSIELDSHFWFAYQQMAALNIRSAKNYLKACLETIPATHPFKKEGENILNFLNEKSFGYQKVL